MIKKIKANLVFSLDVKSYFKSLWIGPLLITWTWNDLSKKIEGISWYGFDYWCGEIIEFEELNNDRRTAQTIRTN